MPTSVLHLKALIWAHAVLGVVLFAGLCFLSFLWSPNDGLVGLAFIGLGVLWLLGIAPLRRKALTLPDEVFESVPPPIPGRALWILGIGQFLSVGSVFLSEFAALIVPLDFLACAAIIAFVMMSDILNLPLHRDSWGKLLAILFLGMVWNLVGAILWM